MITVVRIRNTSAACPATWEGKTDDGRTVYVRYRLGVLRVFVDERTVMEREFGRPLDGKLTYGQLKAVTRGVLRFP